MSTNIPFTLVEGAVALPPLRPLGPLSQTLGREWALLPPNVSLRVELKALYAAMLRTFCLSSQTIRSMCRWEPLTAQVEGSSAAAIATAADTLSQHGSAAAAALASPQAVGTAGSFAAAAAATAGVRPVARTPHRTSNLKLGSAVAIGGAAMLAWIVLDHPHREHANDAAPVANVPAAARVAQQAEPSKPIAVASGNQTADVKSDSKPTADLNPSADGDARVAQGATLANAEPVAPKQVVVASQAPSGEAALARMAAPASSSAAVASSGHPVTRNVEIKAVAAAAPAIKTSIKSVAAKPVEAASSRDTAPVAARRGSTATAATATTSNATTAAPTWTARAAASSPELTVSRSASTSAKPSAAGDYSPFAPSARVDGEYEAVTTSARTYTTYGTTGANTAAPQRAQASQRSNVDANDTSWMGRMSQRRVTEVPELFSR